MPSPGSLFGYVSTLLLNGNAIVIAAPGYSSKGGRLYLCRWSAEWQLSDTISGSSVNQLLGSGCLMFAPDMPCLHVIDAKRREYD